MQEDEHMEFQDTRTFENLNAALAGEARLALLYQIWAARARQQGAYTTAELFEQTARNEISHARLWYGLIRGGEPGTPQNLAEAAELERNEWSASYHTFAQVAREEGYTDIARQFDLVAGIESQHEQRYRQQLAQMDDGTLAHSPGAEWICRQCGYHETADDAPQTCPVCGKGQGYFQKN